MAVGGAPKSYIFACPLARLLHSQLTNLTQTQYQASQQDLPFA